MLLLRVTINLKWENLAILLSLEYYLIRAGYINRLNILLWKEEKHKIEATENWKVSDCRKRIIIDGGDYKLQSRKVTV